ncbi:hypothetical protein [Pantoea stewartii]|uniref:hypothetical protein n=1 Tax=Pantoea stewartii TaxID=66269 RepID=UPI0019823E3D|nr:hypothetical protein [Pantoea stewartii]
MRYLNDDGSINVWSVKVIETKSAPVTYFGFKKINSGYGVRDAFQIKGKENLDPLDPLDKTWSDGRLRGEFDTLQLYENGVPQVRHPRMFGDQKDAPLEPFTEAYPEYGAGKIEQMHADNKIIEFDKVDILPERE